MSNFLIQIKVPQEEDPTTWTYLYPIDNNPQYQNIKALIDNTTKSTFDLSTDDQERIVLESLKHLKGIILKELSNEFFNIVFIMTYIDAVHEAIHELYQPHMDQAFLNEAVRLLITYKDLNQYRTLRSAVDIRTYHRFSAVPVSSGESTPVQKNYIIQAVSDNWHLLLDHAGYPQNFTFSYFGDYSKLLQTVYADTDMHQELPEKYPKKAPQPRLVEYPPKLQAAFEELHEGLKSLNEKEYLLRIKQGKPHEASCAASLYKSLSNDLENCKYNNQYIPTFLKNSREALEKAKASSLNDYVDTRQILKNIALAIVGLGVFYLMAIGINRAVNKRWLFFKNEAMQQVDQIQKTVNEIAEIADIHPEQGAQFDENKVAFHRPESCRSSITM